MPEYLTESSELSFSHKFKALRSFYHLSTRDMAALLNYKSPANIAYFEKSPMTNKPSYQTFINLQQIYGISIDWMLGLNNTPYTVETVKQAEIQQMNRFILDPLEVKKNPESPESTVSFLKTDLFPNDVIWKKLQLRDRFTLLLILNFLSVYIFQYYIDHHGGILAKKVHGLKDMLGLNPSVKPQPIKKHAEYSQAFLDLYNAVKSPLGIPYSLYPALVLPGQDKMERLDHPVLDERWDFIKYLESQGIEVDRAAYTDK